MPTTLLDIQKLNGNDAAVGLIEENLKYAPELQVVPFRTIRGTSYKTGIRTALPTTGFRNANEGQSPSKSTFKQSLIECFIFGGNVQADKAVADAYEDGAAALQAIEASGVMQSAMQNLGKQMFYGVTNDGKGFPGLKAALPAAGTTLAGDALTIDATGSTSATASSVYFVKFGVQDLTFVGGQSRAFDLGDFREQMIYDSTGAGYDAYVAALTAWIGMQIGHENVARRIYNLTAQDGKGWTDTLNAKVMATFPVGHRPDAIFCSRRSLAQLQASRTVTLMGTGSNRPNQPNIAPVPTEYEGIPIIATDSILNTDAIGS
jgi:hypothetical protein